MASFSIDIGATWTRAENFRAIIGGRRKILSRAVNILPNFHI
jgi:hypothetical protein